MEIYIIVQSILQYAYLNGVFCSAPANAPGCLGAVTGPRGDKQVDTHCSSHTTGAAYGTLMAAEAACSIDRQCSGVFDNACDGSGDFNLCDADFKLETSSSDSCVYAKAQGAS